jgi:hypothetical protein
LGQPLLQNPGWVYHACLPKKKRRLRNVGSKGREGTRKKKAQGQRRRATFEPAAAAVVPSGSAVSRACVLDYTKTNRKQEEGKRRLQTNKERGVSEKRKEKEKGANKGREDHTFRKPHPRSKECGAAVAPAARARRSHGR